MKVLQFPLSRITTLFVIGILTAYYLKPGVAEVIAISGIAFFIFVSAYHFATKKTLQTPYFAWAVYIISFAVGFASHVVHNDLLDKNHYVHRISESSEIHTLAFTLKERLKPTASNFRYVAEVDHLNGKNSSGQILVNFRKEGFKANPVIGTRFLTASEIYLHQKPLNPDQFDYGKYLENKSIYAQTYIAASEAITDPIKQKDWFYYSDVLRSRMSGNLEKSGFGLTELGVINALILGQRQDISDEIVEDYQFSGAIHILSVSGLHVGLLLLFLNFVLRIIPQNKLGNVSKLFIVVTGLWVFALIAGFSPSVVRSVTMFSFVAVGMYLKRNTNTMHTMVFSILVILLFKPSFLFDVGFQLSYLAVFFIIWLQPLLSKIWRPKLKWQQYFWDILTVSFAAQLGTMPLALYYFHQFPSLFFITNLVILPALGFIMGYGVIVLVFSFFSTLPFFVIKGLEWSIYALNQVIGWIASFEDFVFRDIPFNSWMMISFYGFIFTVIIWIKKPYFSRLVAVMIAILLFQASYFGTHFQNSRVDEWIVFHKKKQTLMAERIGKEVTVFSNMSDTNEKYSPLNAYLVNNFCKTIEKKEIDNLYSFNGAKILVIDSAGVYPLQSHPDVVVLIQSPKINLERMLRVCKPKMIVADGSNYRSYTERWKVSCDKQKTPFHATAEKGFYKIR